MRDFRLETYEKLLNSLRKKGYLFTAFVDFFKNNFKKIVILRHDIDNMPNNALRMAELENTMKIKGSYFFRVGDQVFDEEIIEKIVRLEHEISYHYEDLSLCRGNYQLAIKNFETNLENFRKIYPVKTICMHGSPLRKYNNKKIWQKYDYRDFGIIADPAFDIDYDEVFYITDTGRSWNNPNASVRDKVNSKFDIKIKDTYHLIEKIQNNELPDKIMINVHPQRWNDEFAPWFSELVRQKVKNVLKKYLIKARSSDYAV